MTNLNNIKSLYFIGAGGIGMSNLVRYFLSKGKNVAGYDRVESELTKQLNKEGAQIHYEDNISLIPEIYKDKENTLIVLTPAVPSDHSELNYFKNNGFEIMKRAQLLGEITKTNRAICVAGTHGKTTVSSMIAHLLKQSHVDCNAFLGGILKNYNSNLLLSDKSDLTVIEADEYDRSFHWLSPYMAVITSADPDHLDIYGTEEAYRESFEHFTSLIRENGVLLMKESVDIVPRLKKGVKLYRYSPPSPLKREQLTPDNFANQVPFRGFRGENIKIGNGEIFFDFVTPTEIIKDVQLGVPVKINIENAVAAMAIAWLNGVKPEELKAGIKSFQGAKRRFDFHLKTDKIVLIDDYAHHPEELFASISSVKELYPDRKLTTIFQPHLYSRTKDFYKEFAKALSLSDETILIDIYPAREEPIEGVTSQLILDNMPEMPKKLCSKTSLLDVIKEGNYEVVLMAGAGDIELLVEPVKNLLVND
ncbi:MAG: UDP-N-acetylmuramate--L-alanine ligase [Dysgonamonadaceae bacterium]|jgi:UDP-N-acetylmuramate--alanine ligase|nr:UDP-N-acetylmuramate--L-alanine ligase [Dysgonamonadaceae bacterium]